MNRKMKRAIPLSLLLCLALFLSLLPAAFGDDQDSAEAGMLLTMDEPVSSVLPEDAAPEEPDELPIQEEAAAEDASPAEDALPITEEAEDIILEEGSADAEVLSGTPGGSVVASGDWYGVDWVLDDTGTLVFSGDGPLENIGMGTFEGWRRYTGEIRTVILNPGITRIGWNAFFNCTALTRVQIPSSVTEISNDAFHSCSALTEFTIPGSVTTVGRRVFTGCSGLKTAGPIGSGCDIEFGWTKAVPDNAFNECEILTAAIIPAGITSIGYGAFSYCTALQAVTLPAELTSIDICAFIGCGSLTEVTIPAGVTEIADSVFAYCSGLQRVTIPAGVTRIGNSAFGQCRALESVAIPAGVTEIGDNSFAYCEKLQSLKLPPRLTRIGYGAFAECSGLTTMTIPDGVMEIGDFALYGTDVEEIRFLGEPPAINAYAFKDLTAFAYYPTDRAWTSYDLKNYGGLSITWVSDPLPAFIRRAYSLILGREADHDGLAYYFGVLSSRSLSAAQLVSSFMNSPEFTNKQLAPSSAVTIVYRTMLDREPDPDGLAYHSANLDRGLSYNAVINSFSGSPEFAAICSSYHIEPGFVELEWRDRNPLVTAFVNRNYLYALERSGEADGLNFYTHSLLEKTLTPYQTAHNFVFSPECVGRGLSDRAYIEMLYHLYMDRDADAGGLNYYLTEMQKGRTREQVEVNFANSPEFQQIVSDYGL